MFSFDNGKLMALALDKGGNIVHEIKVLPEAKEEPDIEPEDIFDIVEKSDFKEIAKTYRLSPVEKSILEKAVEKRDASGLSQKIQSAYEGMLRYLKDKTKKELLFDEELTIIPCYGYNDVPYDRHVFFSGASGSGKSHLVGKMLEYDARKRPILLFSKVHDDPAYEKLLKKDKNGKSRMKHYKIETAEDLIGMPTQRDLYEEKGVICLYDDIDTYKDKEVVELLRDHMNNLLETGRHENVSVLATSHKLNAYNKTKCNTSEAEYIVLYPHSNKALSESFMKERLSLPKKRREYIIDKCSKNRYMIIKLSHPMCVIHEHGIVMID
jgi:hypothetical protein